MAKFTTKSISFKVYETDIDHFMVPVDLLAQDGFKVHEKQVFDPGSEWQLALPQYLDTKELLTYRDIGAKETVILDIPVGRGKTTACYNTIEYFAKDEQYVILVLSPFKKLVDKDYEAIIGKGIDAFNYQSLANVAPQDASAIIADALTKRVHVMTINCLLQNPGEDAFDQAAAKRGYLDSLRTFCATSRKKVVMFFDELHESITYFKPMLVPNMMKWRELVVRCYISSATFSPACYPVIKYIALLTDNNIYNLWFGRHKWPEERRSKIHLHIIDEEYSASYLAPLFYLDKLLKHNLGKQVNILSGTKALITNLNKKKIGNSENPFYETFSTFKFNEVTADTENKFDQKGNNIGTTFKTGVNIDNPDSLFIILMPVVTDERKSRGAFNDGFASMTQAIARLREPGNIHVFMHMPKILFEFNPTEILPDGESANDLSAAERLPENFSSQMRTGRKNRMMGEMFELLHRDYYRRFNAAKNELEFIYDQQLNNAVNLGYTYPSFEEYLMKEGTNKLLSTASFGGDLSSLMLWACLHGQFVNADLETIKLHARSVEIVKLSKDSLKADLKSGLSEVILSEVKKQDLLHGYLTIVKALTAPYGAASSDHPKRIFSVDGSNLTVNSLTVQPWFMKTVILLWCEEKGLAVTEDNLKETYLIHSMCHAMWEKSGQRNDLKTAYKSLFDIYNDFTQYCNTRLQKAADGTTIIHVKKAAANLPDSIVRDMKEILATLRMHDALIRAKAVSFLQNLKDENNSKDKAAVFKELRNLFTNISTNENERRSVGKEIGEYFPVHGKLEKELPETPIVYLY